MTKRSPSYSSLLLKCDHKSFPICVLYLWHESQHPEKVHRRTKGHCIRVLKEREKKNSKSWLLISNALWERSSSKGGNVKINKGRHHYTGVRSPAGGALTDTPLTHIQIPTEKETYLVSLVGSDTTIASRRKKNFPLAWHQLGQWETVATQPVQKITILWTPSFLQLTFYLQQALPTSPSPL